MLVCFFKKKLYLNFDDLIETVLTLGVYEAVPLYVNGCLCSKSSHGGDNSPQTFDGVLGESKIRILGWKIAKDKHTSEVHDLKHAFLGGYLHGP